MPHVSPRPHVPALLRLLPALPLLLLTASLSGCTTDARESEAEELRATLSGSPAAEEVEVRYSAPSIGLKGSVDVDARLHDGSAPSEVASFLKALHRSLAADFPGHDRSGTVLLDDDDVALEHDDREVGGLPSAETFEQVADLLDEGPYSVDLRGSAPSDGLSALVTLNTQDLSPAQVAARAERLAREHPELADAGWRVDSHPGSRGSGGPTWRLGSWEGHVGAEQREQFLTLTDGMPIGSTLLHMAGETLYVTVPDDTAAAVLETIVGNHLATLDDRSVRYSLDAGETTFTRPDADTCHLRGPAAEALARAVAPFCP